VWRFRSPHHLCRGLVMRTSRARGAVRWRVVSAHPGASAVIDLASARLRQD